MNEWRLFWSQIGTVGLPLLLSAAVAFIFAAPHQMHEVYRTAAQDISLPSGGDSDLVARILRHSELIAATVGLVAVSLAVWLTARQAFILESGYRKRPQDYHAPRVTTWVPRLLAMVPAGATASGLILARIDEAVATKIKAIVTAVIAQQFEADGDSRADALATASYIVSKIAPFNDLMLLFAATLVALALIIFIVVTLLDQTSAVWVMLRPRRFYQSWLSLIFVIVGAGCTAAFLIDPVALPQAIGVVGILCLFLCFFLFTCAQLHTWGIRLNTPLLVLGLIVAIAISGFDLNDNHRIRELPAGGSRPPPVRKLDAAFKQWFAHRPASTRPNAGQRYPVFVIAAQGGGIYAAHHVATFLAEMQDLCPRFAQHIFAISGVSGGSVGATAFAGLTRELAVLKDPGAIDRPCHPDERAKRPTWFSSTMEDLFRRDLLAPLAAGLLFPDFFQRFVPYPLEGFDRARALEAAFERAFTTAVIDNKIANRLQRAPLTIASAFTSHWDPANFPYTPALVLNTTEVGTGARRVISPFTFEGAGLRFLPVWERDPQSDQSPIVLPLSTAAFVSARFPWVTPAAWFETRERLPGQEGPVPPRKIRLVDGGYFENSGVATAADIIEGIIKAAADQRIADRLEIVLIVFASADFQTTRSYGFGETMEPIRAMLNTQVARAGIEIDKALTRLRSLPAAGGIALSARLVKLELKGEGYPLPLGWRLSPVTRHLISHQNGLELKCERHELNALETGRGIKAGCVKKLIHDRLK